MLGELGNHLTVKQLNEKITVGSEADSQVVNITVQDPNPHVAAEIANVTAKVFKKEIVNIMNVDNVSILANAIVDDGQAPVKPQPLFNMAIAFATGLLVSIGLAFLMEYLDNKINTEQELEQILDVPVLGVIPTFESFDKGDHRNRKTKVQIS